MSDVSNHSLKQANKKLLLIGMIDMPAMLLLGFGLFGKFSHSAQTVHPLLTNANLTTAMIVVGGLISSACMAVMFKVLRK